jgi:WD40 repeat protein
MLIQVSGLEGHTGELNSVARSSSGERLASALGDEALMDWDKTSGMQVTGSSLPLMLIFFSGIKVCEATLS